MGPLAEREMVRLVALVVLTKRKRLEESSQSTRPGPLKSRVAFWPELVVKAKGVPAGTLVSPGVPVLITRLLSTGGSMRPPTRMPGETVPRAPSVKTETLVARRAKTVPMLETPPTVNEPAVL